MQKIGSLDNGNILVEVSPDEWGALQRDPRMEKGNFTESDVYKFLEARPLPGLGWRRSIRRLYVNGEIDGSVASLYAFLKTVPKKRELLYITKRGRDRLLETLENQVCLQK